METRRATPPPSITPASAPAARRTRSHFLPALVAACALVAAGCGGEDRETIPRETFIEAYVALRTVAIRSPDGEVDPISRARILEERGISEEDLLHFVEVHGRDVPFMGTIWEEVEVEMNRRSREAEQGVS